MKTEAWEFLVFVQPHPCGYSSDPVRPCMCAPTQIQKYRGRISGPILDRIDLHIEAPAVRYEDLKSTRPAESSSAIRRRVVEARQIQLQRYAGASVYSNALMKPKQVKKHCQLDSAAEEILKQAINRLGLSARAYHRILKVARTIADLDHQESIASHHLLESIQYRSLDRSLF